MLSEANFLVILTALRQFVSFFFFYLNIHKVVSIKHKRKKTVRAPKKLSNTTTIKSRIVKTTSTYNAFNEQITKYIYVYFI